MVSSGVGAVLNFDRYSGVSVIFILVKPEVVW